MEIKIGTIGFANNGSTPKWADSGWRNCDTCGGAFWDNDNTRTTCCDRQLILDDCGKIAWITK